MGSTLAFPFMLPDAGKDEEVSLESTLNQKKKVFRSQLLQGREQDNRFDVMYL